MNLYQNKNLLAAFDLYVREQDALLSDEEALADVTLSPAFHTKMEQLLTRRKRGFYVLFGTAGRRVASILIALLIATTTVTVSVKALREKVVGFLTEVFEKYTQITFADDPQNAPEQTAIEPRKPTYLPDGYVMEGEEAMSNLYRITYTNPTAPNSLQYTQRRKDSGELRADTEKIEYREITISNYVGIAYSNKEITTILFSDDRYTFTLSGPCSLGELIKAAESIQ